MLAISSFWEDAKTRKTSDRPSCCGFAILLCHLLGVAGHAVVFPTVQLPECFYFSPANLHLPVRCLWLVYGLEIVICL